MHAYRTAMLQIFQYIPMKGAAWDGQEMQSTTRPMNSRPLVLFDLNGVLVDISKRSHGKRQGIKTRPKVR